MDLIYMDNDLVEIGVLRDFTLDLAYGIDENNFELTLSFAEHCCEIGYYFYIADTEYGGIIDSIEVDTSNGVIKYAGRTWHGILNSKAIQPDPNNDYYVLNGDANSCIKDLLKKAGLTSLFYCPNFGIGVNLNGYKIRYGYLYDILNDALSQMGLRLNMYWANEAVYIEAVPIINFGDDEEWLNAHQLFRAKKVRNRVNHVICLGQGELARRYVIHLFADENGGIQPYNTASQIVDDSGYILNESRKILTEEDEIITVYDNPSAEFTSHFVPLSEQPSEWSQTYEKYFLDPEGKKNVESEKIEVMPSPVTSAPNWEKEYSKYYYYTGKEFKSVEPVIIETSENYVPLTGMPDNWINEATSYFVYESDGVSWSWQRVRLPQLDDFRPQTQIPTDWSDDDGWKNYYIKWYTFSAVEGVKALIIEPDGEKTIEKVIEVAPNWKKNTYYKRSDKGNYILLTKQPKNWKTAYTSYYAKSANTTFVKADTRYSKEPIWKAKDFYTKYSKNGEPIWDDTKQYAVYIPATKNKVAPPFQAGVYYAQGTKIQTETAPAFIPNRYYEERIDHYAVLVEGGLEKLQEYYDSDEITMNLAEDDYTYNIGDMVSATESITGVTTLSQPITKKIVKIDRTGMSIEYQIGGK